MNLFPHLLVGHLSDRIEICRLVSEVLDTLEHTFRWEVELAGAELIGVCDREKFADLMIGRFIQARELIEEEMTCL